MVDMLKMNTINIDLETLGVNPRKNDIYSGAVYSTFNGAENQSQSFFNIGNNKKQLNNTEEYQDLLASSHDSLKFGIDQKDRGSLLGWSKRAINNDFNSLPHYVKSILDHSLNSDNGSILLAQNLQFESRALTSAFAQGKLGKEFVDLHDKLVNKGTFESGSMLVPRDIADESLSRSIYARDDLRVALKSEDKELIQSSLDTYDQKSKNILDMYKRDIEKAVKNNGIATVDLMDYSKAIYSHGARTGQFDPRLLMYGNSIEFLSKAVLGEEEKHEALSDAKQQSKLFNIFNKELEEIRLKGDGYKSPLIKKLQQGFIEHRVLENQMKRSASSFVREHIEGERGGNLAEEVLSSFSFKHRSLDNQGDIAGFNYDNFKKSFKNVLESTEKSSNKQAYIKSLEESISSIKTSNIEKNTFNFSLPKLSSSNKKVIGAGLLAVAGTNLLLGRDKEEESKYTTFDQLYNNQYYGEQFANWENRNNSHRML